MARIVFDLDGTLIDSAPDIHGVANALLEADGMEPITLAQTHDFIGNGPSVFIQKMRAARGIPDAQHARLLAGFLDRYEDAVTLTKPYPNVQETIDLLLEEGHTLGICTNKPIRPCRAVLKHIELGAAFSVVLGGDSLPVRKPDPAPLNAAFNAMHEGERLYVGDSEVDAETAQRAGVPFLLFEGGYRKSPVDRIPHDAVFDAFAELPDLVRDFCAN